MDHGYLEKINHQEFFEKICRRFSEEDVARIEKAYVFSKNLHRGQSRRDGERYFEHTRSVACMLLERSNVSTDQIILGLLHDTEEDCFILSQWIEELFGKIIADGVNTLSKKVPVYDSQTGRIEKFRRTDEIYFRNIIRAHHDVRMVKIADRLHNLQDMSNDINADRRETYVGETEMYILPIARVTDDWFHDQLYRICHEINSLKRRK